MITLGEKPTIVEVLTPWCGACRSMETDIAATAAAHADTVDFVVVDAASSPDTARALGARATPTLIGFRSGTEVFRTTGRRSRADLDGLFADLAARRDPATARRGDRVLWTTTGAALVAIGAVSGPAWPLVGAGAAVVACGLRR